MSDYRDCQDTYDQIGQFINEVYARKRIHSSLGYLTLAEFEQQWRAENEKDPSITRFCARCLCPENGVQVILRCRT